MILGLGFSMKNSLDFNVVRQGSYVESAEVVVNENEFDVMEHEMPFHTMHILAYEARLKKFIFDDSYITLH